MITIKAILRKPNISDAEDLFYLRTNAIVNMYIDREPPKTIREVEKFIENRLIDKDSFYFIIETLPDLKFAGTICLWNIDSEKKQAEIGYELLPNLHGKGIMSNALKVLVEMAFTELEINSLEAYTHKDNIASKKLLQKTNFKLIPEKKDPDFPNNLVYRLNKTCT